MKWWKTLLLMLVTVFLLYFYFKNIEFSEVMSRISALNPVYPLVFALLIVPQYLLRAHRWGILLSSQKQISLAVLYRYTTIGFMISYLLPGRIGEFVRPIMLAEREKIKKSQALASILVERLIDVLTVLLLLVFALLLGLHRHSPLLEKLRSVALVALPVTCGVFLLIYLVNRPFFFPRLEKLIRLFARLLPRSLREKTVSFLLDFIRGLNLNLSARNFLLLAFWSLVLWLLVVFSYWFLLLGFPDLQVSFLETIPYFALLFVSAAIPTPGMAGTLDAASKLGLTQLLGADVNTAVAYTVLFHFILVGVPVLLGLVSAWREGMTWAGIRKVRREVS